MMTDLKDARVVPRQALLYIPGAAAHIDFEVHTSDMYVY